MKQIVKGLLMKLKSLAKTTPLSPFLARGEVRRVKIMLHSTLHARHSSLRLNTSRGLSNRWTCFTRLFHVWVTPLLNSQLIFPLSLWEGAGVRVFLTVGRQAGLSNIWTNNARMPLNSLNRRHISISRSFGCRSVSLMLSCG